MTFAAPDAWWLLLLPLALLPWWRWIAPRRRAAVTLACGPELAHLGSSFATRLRWVLPLLRSLAIAGLVIALARPIRVNEHAPVRVDGIAIELVIDRSSSMAEDFSFGMRRMDRLDVVKRVVEEFVLGTRGPDGLPGRTNDLIGLVIFAREADSICPPTLDHGAVINALRQTRVVSSMSENSTSIGDAVALGVERLRELLEQPLASGQRLRSGVLVLMTDGENNSGVINPVTAAEMAAAFGIRVYAIGAGDAFGQRRATAAETTLRTMAEITGGRFFAARNPSALEQIYREIDTLERTETDQRRYRLEKELAVEPLRLAGRDWPSLLVVVFLLLFIERLLAWTRLGGLL